MAFKVFCDTLFRALLLFGNRRLFFGLLCRSGLLDKDTFIYDAFCAILFLLLAQLLIAEGFYQRTCSFHAALLLHMDLLWAVFSAGFLRGGPFLQHKTSSIRSIELDGAFVIVDVSYFSWTSPLFMLDHSALLRDFWPAGHFWRDFWSTFGGPIHLLLQPPFDRDPFRNADTFDSMNFWNVALL